MADIKLTPAQANMLRRIVASNGGGVSGYERSALNTMRALERRGLVQGMSGREWRAVHTRDVLDWVRANP